MPPGTMKPEQDPHHSLHLACASECLRFGENGPATDSMILLPLTTRHTLLGPWIRVILLPAS